MKLTRNFHENKKQVPATNSQKKYYFKRPWNKTRGDTYDHWGTSIWLFETKSNGEVLRQIEVYENGQKNKYCKDHQEDKYGGLSIYALDLPDFEAFKIKKIEFERVWITTTNENY